jgi:hypothetical protein
MTTNYQPHCDASRTAWEHLCKLRDVLLKLEVDAQLTKDFMMGPWILRCRFPGVRLPEEVICGEMGGWWFYTWRRGELVAPVTDVDEVAKSVKSTPWEDDIARRHRRGTATS